MAPKKPALLSLCLLCILLAAPPQTAKEKDLPQKYQEFLELTHYIMLPTERDVFLQLTTERDRDIFVESFWKQRDPTPGTPLNEFREEHLKRFHYANRFLGRGTPREGWRTDQGRIHILLGPPMSIERFEGSFQVYPTQVWYYYGDAEKSLPSHFAVVFYKKQGAGEYRLYDPASDGPASLLIRTEGLDITDYEQLYYLIEEEAPTLAPVSLSMIPGEIPWNFQPSLETPRILSSIYSLPTKNINPAYATHFLDYKGIVSTEYMTNFVDSASSIALIKDPVTGIRFLHFSLVPERVSVDYYEPNDQYYCSLRLSVNLRIEDKIVFQYSRNLPIYIPPEELNTIRAHGFSIEDSFPVIEGEFQLVVLLQNSVAKEFTLVEKDIVIPEDSGNPEIQGPFLGEKFQDYDQSIHVPFKVLDKKLIIDPKNTYSAKGSLSFLAVITNVTEDLWREGSVDILLNGLAARNPAQKKFSAKLRNQPYSRTLSLHHTLSAQELIPDYYEMKLVLRDRDGISLDEKKANFILSAEESILHPMANAKGFLLANSYLYHYMLAAQFEQIGDLVRAEESYENAFSLKSDYKKGLIDYARFLVKAQKFEKSLALVENAAEDEELKFEYYLIKGLAYKGLEQYDRAIENLLEGNEIYDSDTRLLNALGLCYYETGLKDSALQALKASLRLNPDQPFVRKFVGDIEKELNE